MSAWEAKAEKDGLYAIAVAIKELAGAMRKLGLSDAATQMGAMELLAKEVKGVASALDDLSFNVGDLQVLVKKDE